MNRSARTGKQICWCSIVYFKANGMFCVVFRGECESVFLCYNKKKKLCEGYAVLMLFNTNKKKKKYSVIRGLSSVFICISFVYIRLGNLWSYQVINVCRYSVCNYVCSYFGLLSFVTLFQTQSKRTNDVFCVLLLVLFFFLFSKRNKSLNHFETWINLIYSSPHTVHLIYKHILVLFFFFFFCVASKTIHNCDTNISHSDEIN